MVLVAALLPAAIGCATTGVTSESLLEDRRLVNRAAFDLNCTEPLGVTPIDAKTRGVRGCGKQATYVQICDAAIDNPLRSCVWVMNNAHPGEIP